MSIIQNKIRFIKQIFGHNHLKYCVLLLTNKCNLNCDYCHVKNNQAKELTKDEWFLAVDRLSNWGISHFNILGGEPLIRKDLPEIVSYISNKGLGVTLTTNGILLNKSLLEDLQKRGLFMLIVSIDELDGHSGKSQFYKRIELLKYARQLGIVPVVHSVITSHNVMSISSLAQQVTKHGVFFSCSIYQSVGGLQSQINDTLIPNPNDIELTFRELIKLKQRTGMIRTTYSYMTSYLRYNTNKWRCNPNDTKWLAVGSDGTLLVCAEWATTETVFDIYKAPGYKWNQIKRDIVENCSGCYYECYFSEEQVFHLKGLLTEIPRSLIFWRTVLSLIFANLIS